MQVWVFILSDTGRVQKVEPGFTGRILRVQWEEQCGPCRGVRLLIFGLLF